MVRLLCTGNRTGTQTTVTTLLTVVASERGVATVEGSGVGLVRRWGLSGGGAYQWYPSGSR